MNLRTSRRAGQFLVHAVAAWPGPRVVRTGEGLQPRRESPRRCASCCRQLGCTHHHTARTTGHRRAGDPVVRSARSPPLAARSYLPQTGAPPAQAPRANRLTTSGGGGRSRSRARRTAIQRSLRQFRQAVLNEVIRARGGLLRAGSGGETPHIVDLPDPPAQRVPPAPVLASRNARSALARVMA